MNFNNLFQMNASLEIFSATIILILFVTCLLQKWERDKMLKWFLILLILDVLMLFFDAPIWILLSNPSINKVPAVKILTFLSDTMSCCMMIAYICCLTEYISKYKKTTIKISFIVSILCMTIISLCFVSMFNDMFIVYDLNGVDGEGPLSILYKIMFVVPQIISMIYIFANITYVGLRKTLLLAIFCAIPLISTPMQFFWEVTPVYLATTFSLILCYALFISEQIQKSAEKDKELLKKEIELIESKNAIFLSQIQPHFYIIH